MNTAVATAPAKPVIRRLPPLSAVANRITQQAHDAETDMVAVARLLDGEVRAFGQDHAAAGAELAEAWALPAAIVEAIAMHHQPVSQLPESPAAQAVWLASLTSDGAPGLEAMPLLAHIQTGLAHAQAACTREIESLCCAVGA